MSQLAGLPLSKPRLNQARRWAEVPWVKLSGTTRPLTLLLQPVVADGLGGIERLFQIAALQHLLFSM